MQTEQRRLIFWGVIGAGLVVALLFAFRPSAVQVDLHQVANTPLKVSVTDEGETRIHDVYTLSAPIAGNLRRVELEVGDLVEAAKTVVAGIEPLDPAFLDPRSEAQAKAAIETARSAQEYASEQVNQAQADMDFAQTELQRIRELRAQGTASQRELDNAERGYKSSKAALATSRAALQMRIFELEKAKAQLMPPSRSNREQARQNGSCDCLNIIAPIDGQVLKVITKSEGVVKAGTPLVEIGDPRDLEVVAEFLSVDAVKMQPGMQVMIRNWGGIEELQGRISRIEPFGFTKISALGIEEQRVNVIVELTSDYPLWQKLGHGYQVDASVILWQQENVLTVPITALFRQEKQWAVYVVEDGQVSLRAVQVGRKNRDLAQVLEGLQQNDLVITHPDNRIYPGVRVEVRSD